MIEVAAEPQVYSYHNKENFKELVRYRLMRPDEDPLIAAVEDMALRAWRPARIAVARGPLRGFSLAALGCLAALILVDRRHGIVAGVAPRSPSRCRSAC